MTTITQTIAALPTAPSRSQNPATFVANADAFVDAQAGFVAQVNTLTGQINTVSGEVAANAATATTQAGIATTQAGNAATSVSTATTQAGNAAASAASALAIYGNTTAMNNAVASASASSSSATSSANAAGTSASAASTSATNAANAAGTAGQYSTALAAIASQTTIVPAATVTGFNGAIVATCIYDTKKDSDGGAWRKRCQNTSWYSEVTTATGAWRGFRANEAAARAVSGATTGDYFFNTTDKLFYSLNVTSGVTQVYRGSRREFPEVVGITVEAGRVVLWDLTDATMPMWKSFITTAGYALHSGTINNICALNGLITVGMSTQCIHISLSSDRVYKRDATNYSINSNGIGAVNTAGTWRVLNTTAVLVNASVISVAATILPNAPIDNVTSLPIPTIAVCTGGGVSVINDSGTITNPVTGGASTAYFVGTRLWAGGSNGVNVGIRLINSAFTAQEYYFSNATYAANVPILSGSTGYEFLLGVSSNMVFRSNSNATWLTMIYPDYSNVVKSMIAEITNTYNSGWQVGGSSGAWLSDTVAGAVGATDADRSVKANPLTLVGALTKAAVASGAQLMAYSGFATGNYLEQAYSANLDFGTTGFLVMGWINVTAKTAIQEVFCRDSATTGIRWTLDVNTSGFLTATCFDGTTTRAATGAVDVSDSLWHRVTMTYSAGTVNIYLDGVLHATATGAALNTLNNATAVFRVGIDAQGLDPATSCSFALFRVSATIPSADKLSYMYETERKLFEPGAQCSIAGNSTTVTALSYDDTTNLLQVGTSWGHTEFQGLKATNSTATAVGAITAHASSGGYELIGGASGAVLYKPSALLIEELARTADQRAAYGSTLIPVEFDAITSQVAFICPLNYKARYVYSAGALKRSGSTKDYTINNDGFRDTVTFAVAPGNTVWVSILCTRS